MSTETKNAASEAFDALSINPEMFKDSYEKAAKGMAEFADFQKASLEAFMGAASTFAKGVEKAATEQASFTKESFEEGVAAAKATFTSKSIQEAMDVQTDFARSAFEKNLAQANKVTEHFTALGKDVAQPITDHYGTLVEKVQSFRP